MHKVKFFSEGNNGNALVNGEMAFSPSDMTCTQIHEEKSKSFMPQERDE